ncbi:MAG: hypothetical protein JST35_11025 [Armatimonadetes bacterium]|nr:hypothetical protein [Armatimonadota bacterium]
MSAVALRALPLFEALLPEEPCVVLEARRDVAFAGKIGQRVIDELLVERGGKKFLLQVGRRPGRTESNFRAYEVGERLYVPGTPAFGKMYIVNNLVQRALVLVDTSEQGSEPIFAPSVRKEKTRVRRTVAAARAHLAAKSA